MLPGIAAAEIDDFLDHPFKTPNPVPFAICPRPSSPDPDDERNRELAVQRRATIVSHGKKDFVGADQFGVEKATRRPARRVIPKGG